DPARLPFAGERVSGIARGAGLLGLLVVRPVNGELDERGACRDRGLDRIKRDELGSGAEFSATLAERGFEFVGFFFELLDLLTVDRNVIARRTSQREGGKSRPRAGKPIKECLILRIGSAAQRSNTVGHCIQGAPLAA